MLGLVGVTAIDANVAAVTVRVAIPCFDVTGSTALIVVEPAATALASPLEPATLLIVATTPDVDSLHVTDDVKSCVVWSE